MAKQNVGHLEAQLGLNDAPLLAGLGRAQAAMKAAGASMTSIGRSISLGVSLPLKIAGIAGAKWAADFQKEMRTIQTLVGLSTERVNSMAAGVKSLAKETGQSSTHLAKALFVITSAGQRGAEAMDILTMSAKASAIGLGETSVIARAVTSAMNAYGKENLSAERATDILLATVREGNLEADSLAGTLGRVIGVSSTLGISFEEIGASIATFTRLGVSAEEAVTGLRGIMNTLMQPADKAREALAKTGMTFADLRKKVKEDGLGETLINLVTQFRGNEEALSDLVPNVRALAAVLGTAGVQSKQYIQIIDSITRSMGLTDAGFKSIAQDSGFQFAKTLNMLKGILKDFGEMLLPVFNKLFSVIQTGVDWFKHLNSETKQLIGIGAMIVAAIGPAIFIVGKLIAVIAAISGPMVLAVAATAALGAGIAYVWDNWKAIKDRVSNWGWWKNVIIDMTIWLIEKTAFAFSFVLEQWNKLMIAIGMWHKVIEDPFKSMIDFLEDMKDKTTDSATEFGDFGRAIGNAVDFAKKKLLELADLVGLVPGGATLTGGVEPTKTGRGRGVFDPFAAKEKPRAPGFPEGMKRGTMPISEWLKFLRQENEFLVEEMKKSIGYWQAWMQDLYMIQMTAGKNTKLAMKDVIFVLDQSFKFMEIAAQGMANVFVGIGESIGEALAGVPKEFETPLQTVILIIADFAKSVGSMLVGIATLMMLGASIIPGLAIPAGTLLAVGLGLTVLGAGVSAGVKANIAKKQEKAREQEKVQGLASGGFVTSGGVFQLHRNELVTLPAGSAVTPASMTQYGGESLEMEITLRKLLIKLDRERDRRNR